jgi:phenylalanine-4-hydroxylase
MIVPNRDDWTIPQAWHAYTHENHATWNTLFERQTQLLPRYACKEFVAGLNALPLSAREIPNFDEINDTLKAKTGWTIVAVPGLIPDDVFFTHLANRRFPSGNFIRRADQLDYLEEPDVFHDVFGHTPMLMNPIIADFIAAYGEGGLRAQRLDVLPLLSRVYWYTIEFGLVLENNAPRVFGAGIASSLSETQFAIESPSPNRIAFDLARVMRTHYRIDDFQETYFVLNRFDDLLDLASLDFAPLYERVQHADLLPPGEITSKDRVIQMGTGAYHAQSARNASA